MVEGENFKKSEKFWFKFQNVFANADCNDGNLSDNSLFTVCRTFCVCFPRTWIECIYVVRINATTYNFTELGTQVIENKEGIINYEGSSYDPWKRIFACDTCFLNGVCKLRNTSSDFIGCRLGIDNDRLLTNKEYLQLGAIKSYCMLHHLTKFF